MAKDNGGSFSAGLILGTIIGTVAGILMAPKPGSETRSELLEKSDYWREKAERFSDIIVEKLGPTLETVRENVPPTIENMKARIDPLIEQVNSLPSSGVLCKEIEPFIRLQSFLTMAKPSPVPP